MRVLLKASGKTFLLERKSHVKSGSLHFHLSVNAARGTRLNVRPMLEKEEQGDEQNCKSEHIFELPTLKAMIPPDFSGYVLIVCVIV